MALNIYVENRNHDRVRSLVDDADGSLMAACRSAIETSCVLGSVSPYGDTMFNEHQLKRLLVELDEVVRQGSSSPAQRRLLQELDDAAREAIQIHGYLFISGD